MIQKIENYERIELHKNFILDHARNSGYRKAIHTLVKPNDVVLDIGCGTGILSFFAAQAKCKKIYAVDRTGFIEHAKKTAALNKFSNMEFIKSDLFDLKLSEKVDVLIHEQIGDYVWDEGMVEMLSYAKNKFLKRGGMIIPFKVDVYMAPVCLPSFLATKGFWQKKRYGINLSNWHEVEKSQMYRFVKPTRVEITDRKSFLGDPVCIASTDLYKMKSLPEKSIRSSFTIRKNGVCTGVLGYFRTYLSETIAFDTAPRKKNTHWGQFFLPIPSQRFWFEGEIMNFNLRPSRNIENWRWNIGHE